MDKLRITKRSGLKGEDGYKTFSIRVREDIVGELDKLSAETNRSRNELINKMLEFALENCEVTDSSK